MKKIKIWILVLMLVSSSFSLCSAAFPPLRTSERGGKFIKSFESSRLVAYKCPAGVWTIGYGHTRTAKPGMIITKEKAEMLLRDDLMRFESYVNTLIELGIRQNKFDALVSFSYNCGYRLNKVKKEINSGLDYKVCSFLKQFKYAKGRILLGLVRRRAEECNMYLESSKLCAM